MTLQTAGGAMSPPDAYSNIRNTGFSTKSAAQNFLTFMQSNNINTLNVFQMLDQLSNFVASFTSWKAIIGLDTYATSVGYTGSMVSDCNGCISAANAVIAWVVANFPASSGFLQAEKLNVDGSRTLASFTPAQTSGLQSALTSFIATIN